MAGSICVVLLADGCPCALRLQHSPTPRLPLPIHTFPSHPQSNEDFQRVVQLMSLRKAQKFADLGLAIDS